MEKTNIRATQTIPRNMDIIKREFTKVLRMYTSRSQKIVQHENRDEGLEEIKEVPIESKVLLWFMIQELSSFITLNESKVCEDISQWMDENDTNKIVLPEHGLVLEFDTEAKWFTDRELTVEEWKEYDKACNENYLQKKLD